VGAIGAAAAWQQASFARQAAEAATERADAAAVVLGALAARTVEDGALAALQKDATALARRLGAEETTIELSDGQVLFDLRGQRQSVQEVPKTWTSLPAADPTALRSGSAVQRLTVPGRGDVLVSVALPAQGRAFDLGELSVPAGLAGLLIAVTGGLFVRALRLARPLRQISGALAAAAAGERCTDALSVNERWGASAEGWNALLADRERMRGELLDELSTQVSGAGAGDSLAQRACDTLPIGLLLLDGVGGVRYGNGAAAMLLGVAREAMAGRSLADVLSDPGACEQISAVLPGGSRRRAACEGERRVGDNRSILRFTAMRMGHEDGDAVMVIVEDVTQQRTADAARDAFVAQATHELRTPLTNIRLYLEMLQEGESDAAEQERSLNVISQESRRLERMVGDMLSVAEIEAGSLKMRMDDVRLEQLLAELEGDYRAQAADANITLTFDLPPKLPVIRGDRDKIALLLHNLIANALKYTPAGGVVVVTAEDHEESFVARVSDTGLGIAPDERERIFQKFYRSKDDRIAGIPGTGLGLALARDVARLHGGDITVESEVGRGSTFTVSIPVKAKAA
jgi:PAS domain S-box-containing protein